MNKVVIDHGTLKSETIFIEGIAGSSVKPSTLKWEDGDNVVLKVTNKKTGVETVIFDTHVSEIKKVTGGFARLIFHIGDQKYHVALSLVPTLDVAVGPAGLARIARDIRASGVNRWAKSLRQAGVNVTVIGIRTLYVIASVIVVIVFTIYVIRFFMA